MKVFVVGDFCPRNRVAEMIDKERYEEIFGETRKLLKQEAEYAIVNFECPVVNSFDAKPIEKEGPNLKCSGRAAVAMQYAGFNCVTLANNHFYDYGEGGVKDTLDRLAHCGIDYVGGGKNFKQASEILYKEFAGERLAIINCCEHEFSIATPTTGGSNPLNPIQQYYQIQDARRNADYVLVIVHGGHEHYNLPSVRMQDTYRFFIDAGADAVINHHQHCYSGYEWYQGKPIVYGLGNFCFDVPSLRDDIWNRGYMACVTFGKEVTGLKIYPYEQCGDNPSVHFIEGEKLQKFHVDIETLNRTIADHDALEDAHRHFMDTANLVSYQTLFEPYQNKYLKALYKRKLLPSFVGKKKQKIILNFLMCESHLERTIYAVRKML